MPLGVLLKAFGIPVAHDLPNNAQWRRECQGPWVSSCFATQPAMACTLDVFKPNQPVKHATRLTPLLLLFWRPLKLVVSVAALVAEHFHGQSCAGTFCPSGRHWQDCQAIPTLSSKVHRALKGKVSLVPVASCKRRTHRATIVSVVDDQCIRLDLSTP